MRASSPPQFSKLGFLKDYFLPLLIVFLLPGFGWWFFAHAERTYDDEVREALIRQIEGDADLSTEEKAQLKGQWADARVSYAMASFNPEAIEFTQGFPRSLRIHYGIFRWMRRTAMICVICAVVAGVLVGIGVALSLRSRELQYRSLRTSWHILRITAVIEVIGQGVLAVALSYWVTALWGERYFPKLILGVGILAFAAGIFLIKAIFADTGGAGQVEGVVITEAEQPELWARVTEMARALNIPPPDNIILGIDDNFFVTEHPMQIGNVTLHGRTLFASISLLKVLSREEADAILGHELAHFSGEDTVYSRKTSPLLEKYAHYLGALYEGGISRPVFYYMHFFWNLFHISLSRTSREREFRADSIGAQLTSPGAVANALVKVTAYCRYRAQVQQQLFETEQQLAKADIADRIEAGFPEFLRSSISGTELAETSTPHPFDSHPPLDRRITNLGLSPQTIISNGDITHNPSDTWFASIRGAQDMESAQWSKFEEEFQKFHESTLPWRFKPEGEEQTALVLKHFPPLQFNGPKDQTLQIEYDKIFVSSWAAPIPFDTIQKCEMDDGIGTKYFKITHIPEGTTKKATWKFVPEEFRGERHCLDAFQEYYGRHLSSRQYLAEKQKGELVGV